MIAWFRFPTPRRGSHCCTAYPGDGIAAKAVAFDHLIPLVEPRCWPSTTARGSSPTWDDDLDGLERALDSRFNRYERHVSGAVGLVTGWVG